MIQGYAGQKFRFPLGEAGLHTDDSQNDTPITDLSYVSNVVARNGVVEGVPGAIKYNQVAYPAPVVAAYDYFPTPAQQRLIFVCSDGKIYRALSGYTGYTEVTPQVGAPTSLTISPEKQVHIVEGGQETIHDSKRLYIFSGNDPIQVIEGDGLTRRNLSLPAADWSTDNQPIYGIIYRTRLFVLGSGTNAHIVYASRQSHQEDFSTTSSGDQYMVFNVFPGEQDGFSTLFVFQSRLLAFKSPFGIYYLEDQAVDAQTGVASTSWFFKKLNTTFGIASPHAAVPVLSDALVADSTGSIVSLQAVFQLGDIKASDLLTELRCDQYIKQLLAPSGLKRRWAVYYEDQKKVFFACQSSGAITNDTILEIDVSLKDRAKVFVHSCFQANCFALQRDVQGVKRVIYGANDGFVYLMDRPDRNVGGTNYVSKFGTIHTEFGLDQVKLYDFIEVAFESTGKWNMSIDVFIDGRKTQTVTCPMYYGNPLDVMKLDREGLGSRAPRSFVIPIKGSGRRIGFQCYNAGSGQNFKVQSLTVYFRAAGDAQKPQNAQ